MRDIKFRAWDKSNKKMLYMNLCDKNWYYTEFNDENGCNCAQRIQQNDKYNLEIMQYIGLKDKNGKNIYENDIVKQTYFDMQGEKQEKIHEIIYENNYFTFPAVHINIEIIGNIYENPELLEDI